MQSLKGLKKNVLNVNSGILYLILILKYCLKYKRIINIGTLLKLDLETQATVQFKVELLHYMKHNLP